MDFHPGTQGAVWGKNASILEADLSNPALVGVARALAPGVLRLGGSEAGHNVTYTNFSDGSTCPDEEGQPYYFCLSRQRWDEIMNFSKATGARLMLDLNLVGPVHSDDWSVSLRQIDALFEHTSAAMPARADAGGGVWAFELGNENQDTIGPATAAARVAAVAASMRKHWPTKAKRPLLIGPSAHLEPDWMIDFVAELSKTAGGLDVYAYHMYSGFGKAPHIASQVPTPAFLDDARGLVDVGVSAVRSSVLPQLPLMVTETAAAWASGGPTGACISFGSCFWYFDHLAHAASVLGGHVAVARQTLVGGNYSLVDANDNWRAHPDFFVALLWRRVVEGGGAAGRGAQVLRAAREPVIGGDIHRELRCFAACDAGGALVLGFAHLGTAPLALDLKLESGMPLGAPGGNSARQEWVLESGTPGDMLSRRVTLNGALVASEGGVVPELPPREADAASAFTAPAQSLGFLRFPDLTPRACA